MLKNIFIYKKIIIRLIELLILWNILKTLVLNKKFNCHLILRHNNKEYLIFILKILINSSETFKIIIYQ